jgi:hypothetical protein
MRFFINYFEYKLRKYTLENVRWIVSAEGRGEELQDAQLHARCLKGIYRKKWRLCGKLFCPKYKEN